MQPAASFHSAATQFAVADIIKTTEYYRDFLGFEILGYWWDPPEFAIVQRGSMQLQFGLADDITNPQRSNLEHRKIGLDLYIRVTGIEALYEELKNKNVTITEPVCEREYGMIEFSIEDCNGFKIVFGQDNS